MRLPAFVRIGLRFIRVVDAPRWLLPMVIAVTMIAFVFEGFGIYLLVPLLTTLLESSEATAALAGSDNFVLRALHEVAAFFEGPYQIPALLGLIVGCIFLRAVTTFASLASFVYVKHRFGEQLRNGIYRRILSANQSYLDGQPPGALLNMMTTETWRMSEGIGAVAKFITHASAVVVFLVMMLLVSAKLMVIVFLGVAAIMGLAFLVTSRARRFGKAALAENTGLAARINDVLTGLRTVRMFGREPYEQERFKTATQRVRRAFLRMEILNEVPQPMLLFLLSAFFAVLILIAGREQLLTLAVFLALSQRLQPHATYLIRSRAQLLNLAGPLDATTRILNDAAAEPLRSGIAPAPVLREGIRLENVRHRYPDSSVDALRGLSLTIPAGRTTALVGPSGSGKSTVLGLVCRLFDPTEGRVLVDGVPLPEVDLREWRAKIAVVPQDVHIFDATVRDNIAYGRLDATDEEIVQAAEVAGAMEFVRELSEGLDTRLGERGSRLSGGQRQRIALARAVIRNPRLLILDEATNALDNHSERLVREAIARISADRAVLVVAHRLTNVLEAHNVIVLDQGAIAEQGPPGELLRRNGAFAALVAAEKVPA